MILVIGEFRLPLENLAAARGAMARVISATRAEAGCLAYSYSEDVLEPGLLRISERWESQAHLDAHFAAPHMKVWQQARDALGFYGRSVSIIEAGAETRL